MTAALQKVAAPSAAAICAHFDLTEEGQPLLTPEQTPKEFLDLLVEHELFQDAVYLLAHGLPKREAVWWACVCAKTILNEETSPEARVALAAAEAWTYEPSEENRRAAEAAGTEEGMEHAAAWAAMGAFWSGGSMGPAQFEAVPPKPFFTAKAVSAAIMLSAFFDDGVDWKERLAAYVASGVDIASGGFGTGES